MRNLFMPIGAVGLALGCPAEVAAADDALRAADAVAVAPGAPEASSVERAPSESESRLRGQEELSSFAALPTSIRDFTERISVALDWAYDACLKGVAEEIAAAADRLDECELCYLALRIADGFEPRRVRRALQTFLNAHVVMLPEVMPGVVPDLRLPGEMQKAMRAASLSAALMLMPHLDRVTQVAIVSGILVHFPNEEMIAAVAKVAAHLEGDDLFAVAREVLLRLPDTFGYNLHPRRSQHYEDCIRFVLDVMPRLQIERRAVIAFRLMECAYLSDESEERLYEERPDPLIPFRTRRAFLDHYFTAREQEALRELGLRDAVFAELGWNLER